MKQSLNVQTTVSLRKSLLGLIYSNLQEKNRVVTSTNCTLFSSVVILYMRLTLIHLLLSFFTFTFVWRQPLGNLYDVSSLRVTERKSLFNYKPRIYCSSKGDFTSSITINDFRLKMLGLVRTVEFHTWIPDPGFDSNCVVSSPLCSKKVFRCLLVFLRGDERTRSLRGGMIKDWTGEEVVVWKWSKLNYFGVRWPLARESIL